MEIILSVIFDLERKADCVVALHGDGEDGEDAGVRHRQLDVGHKVAHRLKKRERAYLALSIDVIVPVLDVCLATVASLR